MRTSPWMWTAALAAGLGCTGGDKSEGSDSATDDGTTDTDTDTADTADTGGSELEAACTEPTEVECVDALILDLSLHDDKVSDGAVATTTEGDDFVSTIDASAGGYNAAADNAWVYVKFTDAGLEKVEIDDESALESMDWHLSLRRYIVRLNGGTSGPSCVGAASFHESTYADLTTVPDGIPYVLDDYYTSDCTITTDTSGLPGSPSVALGPWWSYEGCVQTTLVPHLLQLDDGRIVKLVVEEYYAENQEVCNNTGSGGDDSAKYTLRWTFMN